MDRAPSAPALKNILGAIALTGFALFLFPAYARAATLYVSPASQQVTVGQIFSVSAYVSSPDQAMNAASGDISFPSSELQVISVSKANSVMNLWIRDPSFTNSAAGGDVHFEGVVLNPGFTGGAGNLITIEFQAIGTGNAPITFAAGAVLANDGNGTNILSGMQSGSVTIGPKPAGQSSGAPASGPTTTTPDIIPPAAFSINQVNATDTTDPQPIFAWTTTDNISRTLTYMVKIGSGDAFNASTIFIATSTDKYQLPLQAPGNDIPLTVIAYDNAGNSSTATTSFSVASIALPVISNYTDQITQSSQLFSARGTGPAHGIIKIYLTKGNTTLAYQSAIDANGEWSVAENGNIPSGVWQLRAQAVDTRGAMSTMTAPEPIDVNGWFAHVWPIVVDWGLVILIGLLLLGAIIWLALAIVHRIRTWRVSSNENLLKLEETLRNDLKRIEKELSAKKYGAESSTRNAIERIEADINKNIGEIDDIEKK